VLFTITSHTSADQRSYPNHPHLCNMKNAKNPDNVPNIPPTHLSTLFTSVPFPSLTGAERSSKSEVTSVTFFHLPPSKS
jgi:hypothetical protein